jgi:hypothetical protein
MKASSGAVLAMVLLVTSAPAAVAAGGRRGTSDAAVPVSGSPCGYPVTLTIAGITAHRPWAAPAFVTVPASRGDRVTMAVVSDPTRSVSVDISGRFQLVSLPDGSLQALPGGSGYTWSSRGVSAVPSPGLTVVDARSRTIDLCAALD